MEGVVVCCDTCLSGSFLGGDTAVDWRLGDLKLVGWYWSVFQLEGFVRARLSWAR